MKHLQTEIVVVLDRSGSMESIAQSTVEGFNTFLNEQKNAEGEAFFTLVQFDDRYEMNYASKPISEVQNLIYGETFSPRGSTALFDTIGKTINDLETDHDVIFVIITDGEENASQEFTREAIFKMIETKESEGWKFLFLAANQDAIKSGETIGVKMSNSMSWGTDKESISTAYSSFSKNIVNYRSAKISIREEDQSMMKEIEKDLFFTDEQRKGSNKTDKK
jgi:hypothetical protein